MNSIQNGHSQASQVEAEFEALLQQHERAVLRLAWGVLRDQHAAEDVAQEALVKLWTALQAKQRFLSCEAWLRTTTLNLCRDRLRSEGVFKKHVPVDPYSKITFTKPDHGERQEALTAIKARFDTLPVQQRQVLVLVVGEGLSLIEAALLMGCSNRTAEKHLELARAAVLKPICEE